MGRTVDTSHFESHENTLKPTLNSFDSQSNLNEKFLLMMKYLLNFASDSFAF